MVPPELAARSPSAQQKTTEEADLSALLSWVFRQAYRAVRPASLLVAPLSVDEALDEVDPRLTRRVVGIDTGMEKVAVARQRHRRLGPALELYRADALRARLQPIADFDFVFSALPLAHTELEPFADAIAGWVAPGGACTVVLPRVLPGSLQAGPGTSNGVEPPGMADLFSARGLRRAGAFVARGASAALWVGHFRAPWAQDAGSGAPRGEQV